MSGRRDGQPACPDLETWSAYADGSLPEAERPALQSHLRSCGHCFGMVSSLRLSLARDQDAEGGATPPDLLARARELSTHRQPRARRWAAYSAAAAVLLAVVSSLYVGQHYLEEAPTAPFLGDGGRPMEEEDLEYETQARRSAALEDGRDGQDERAVPSSAADGPVEASPEKSSLSLGEAPASLEPSARGESAEDYAAMAVEGAAVLQARTEIAAGAVAPGAAGISDVGTLAGAASGAVSGPPAPASRSEPRSRAGLSVRSDAERPAAPEPAGTPPSRSAVAGGQSTVGAPAEPEPSTAAPSYAGAARGFRSESSDEGTEHEGAEEAVPKAVLVSIEAGARPGAAATGPALKSAVPAGEELFGPARPGIEPGATATGEAQGAGRARPVAAALAAGMEVAQLQHAVAREGDAGVILSRIKSLREKVAGLGPAPLTMATLRAMADALLARERDEERAAGGARLMERIMKTRAPEAMDRGGLQLLGQRLDGTLAADFAEAVSAHLACGAWLKRVELAGLAGPAGSGESERTSSVEAEWASTPELERAELAASGAELVARLQQVGADEQMVDSVALLLEGLGGGPAPDAPPPPAAASPRP